mmetsp:Transcript_8108/g.25022  ORF Transcript_8108/g.25022 Transcript_8108/m.25022 type:complete len:153 (+) Transcript_8108:719-1177(+)
MPRVIDLFCGAGGFSCGLAAAGFHIVAGIDNDEDSLKTFHANFPTALTLATDLTSPTTTVRRHLQSLRPDVVVGGPPCQGFSRQNIKQSHIKYDTMRNLSVVFVKFAASLNPKAIMMEQVATFLQTPLYPLVLAAFRSRGYSVIVRKINMAH